MNEHEFIATVLGFSTFAKLKVLRDYLDENNIGSYLKLSKILLDAPINEGGLPTEVIENLFNEWVAERKEDYMISAQETNDNI